VSRLGGLAARLTGGEFLWVPEAQVTLEQLNTVKRLLEQPVDTGDVTVPLRVVIGLVECPKHATTAEELFRRMNIVLDEAKKSCDLILYYDESFEQRYLRRLSIITELKKTLSDHPEELSLYYQPKLNLVSGVIDSAEALIRWTNRTLGFVPPDEFITVAEHAELIDRVTDWVISRAVEDIACFEQASVDVSVAINLSARDIIHPQLLSNVLAKLDSKKLSTHRLSFEITENDLVSDADRAVEYLQAFRDTGFHIALDDFGTGYSSLAYLKDLPIDILKVDKSFVLNLDTQHSDQKIVQSTLSLAHAFGLSVVAEGVENKATLSLLSEWGCKWAQGYYISRPIPADEFIDWYHQQSTTDKRVGHEKRL
jgi:predicted signal transduction protein with EAL and GGDEF domain